LLDELAAQDLTLVGQPPVLAALQGLSTARLANVLRHWLKGLGVRASQAQLLELQQQIQACTTRGHRIHMPCRPITPQPQQLTVKNHRRHAARTRQQRRPACLPLVQRPD
jgi:hypothetical protein